MSALNLQAIAASLYKADMRGHPTALLAQELQLFEVECAALECLQESELRSADWAVLALARAMGRISPALVDETLGLGAAVSEAIVHRLLGDQLLGQADAQLEPEAARTDGGLLSFAKHLLMPRLFGATPPAPPPSSPPAAARSHARKLLTSRAPGSPLCEMTYLGSVALERGVIPQLRVHKARLVFLAVPLLFIRVEDERQQRHTARHRSPPLRPDEVPQSLRELDSSLELPPAERMAACGIGASVAGLSGQLLRIAPGTQWEVRRLGRRVEGQYQPQTATLVLAAFQAGPDKLHWQAFIRHGTQTQACPQIDTDQLIPAQWRDPATLISAVQVTPPLPADAKLLADGAYEVRCDSEQMIQMLGAVDRPCDTLLQGQLDVWHAGLRIHAVPADAKAAHQAFYAFLSRSEAGLRHDFDATCVEVASDLAAYWGHDHVLPSADEASVNLWPQVALRAALCMRRLDRDLVSAYAAQEKQA